MLSGGYRNGTLVENGLRILTGKTHPQIKLKRSPKVLTH